MSKVFLGVGHGGTDSGAVGFVKEKEVNLTMALACKDYLEANGVDVKMSRYVDESESLNEKINECNNYNPDYAIDIHNNAGGGDGFEVFYGISNVGKPLAENIEKEIVSIGQNSRGCKTKINSSGNADYFGFIRDIKCPSIIVEGFFVDNEEDYKIVDTLEEQKLFGVAYAKGILKTLNITTQNTPKEKAPEKNKYIVELQGILGTVKDGIYGSITKGLVNKATVKKGKTGAIVKFVQQRLKDKGYTIVVDGIFGSQTDSVVRKFQKNNGLVADGWAGSQTVSLLLN